MISPVEEYNGVFYKRDDLYYPIKDSKVNGGKVRQAIALFTKNLEQIKKCGTVITSTSPSSPQGLIIATVAKQFGIKCIVTYGSYLGIENVMKNRFAQLAKEAGADIRVVSRAFFSGPIDSSTLKLSKENNYYYIKFGINVQKDEQSIFEPIMEQVQNLPQNLDVLLIPVGSGLIFSGILKGLEKYNINPKRIIGVLSGANSTKKIQEYLINCPFTYELHKSEIPYSTKKTINEPFSIDPIYEAKTILWFDEHLKNTPGKKLIWIVGNQRTMIE